MNKRCSTCGVSVSPLLLCPLREVPDAVGAVGPVVDEEVVGDLKKIAVLGDMIVGEEAVTLDERGQGALAARVLPSPKEPTQAAIDRHNITHLPYESWCPICVSSRRPNDHHRLCMDQSRQIPLLVVTSVSYVTLAMMCWCVCWC